MAIRCPASNVQCIRHLLLLRLLTAINGVFRYLGYTHLLYRQRAPYTKTEKQQELFKQSCKVEITPLVIYCLRGGPTDTHVHKHTNVHTNMISGYQASTWFKRNHTAVHTYVLYLKLCMHRKIYLKFMLCTQARSQGDSLCAEEPPFLNRRSISLLKRSTILLKKS